MCNIRFLITWIVLHVAVINTTGHRYFCPDYRPQRVVDLEKIKGSWNVVEIITHEGGGDEEPNRLDQSEACAMLKIQQESEDGNLTIVNDAGNHARSYFYAAVGEKDPGLWMISGPYKEKVPDKTARILNGNAQVLKAVDEYVILTICTEQEQETEVYSFILVREAHPLPTTDFFDYVNNFLERKRLETLHTARFLCTINTTEITTEAELANPTELTSGASAPTITSLFYLKIVMGVMYLLLRKNILEIS